jgi:hypothetical protein
MVVVGIVGCGSTKHAAATTRKALVSGEATRADPSPAPGKLEVKLTGTTHTPKVRTPWRWTVRATANGKPVAAEISVRVLYQGQEIADLGTYDRPNGRATATFVWPPVSRGHLLVVSARAESKGRVAKDTYQVAGQ